MIDETLRWIEEALEAALDSEVPALARAGQHIVRAGGKRLRPRIVLLAYQAAGGQEPREAVPLAAAMELLHTASLIHDDINDHGDTRRGQPTINALWGNGFALLAGDFVWAQLVRLVAAQEPSAIPLVADTCLAVLEGETRQAVSAGNVALSEAEYMEIIGQKTAALFATCGRLGAIKAAGLDGAIDALTDYGWNLGLAFQIRDDALDLVGAPETLGKPIGRDLEQGKMSLALIYALQRAPEMVAAVKAGDAQRIGALAQETGALDDAMVRAEALAREARAALDPLPPSAAKETLRELAAFALARAR